MSQGPRPPAGSHRMEPREPAWGRTPAVDPELARGFTTGQKAYAQVTFFAMAIAGTAGIALADPRWLAPYVFICWYGIPGIVMRHLSCPRCAHLYCYGDCLQFPARWTRWLVKKPKSEPFSRLERAAFYAIFILLPAYPLYWLMSQPVLLTVFVAAAIAWYLGQLAYFCKRCRVTTCPFNRSPCRNGGFKSETG